MKRNVQVLPCLRVFSLQENCKNLDILYLRLLIQNFYKSNELRAEVNPGILHKAGIPHPA